MNKQRGAVISWRSSRTDLLLGTGWMSTIQEMKRHENIYTRLPDSMAVLGTVRPLLVTSGVTLWRQQAGATCRLHKVITSKSAL